MAGEILAGLSGFKAMLDIAKGLKDVSDATARNAIAVELQEKILAAQAAQTDLIHQVRELEEKVAKFEAWGREKRRYELTDFGSETFAYILKPDKAEGEPTHRLCANCYQRDNKSILQFRHVTNSKQDSYKCNSCETIFEFGVRQRVSINIPRVNTRKRGY
jgi:hypothetical protein